MSVRSTATPGSGALAGFHAIVSDPYAQAMQFKAEGGTVIAYLCDNVPVELIAAAGFFPCRLGGAGGPEREGFKKLVESQWRASQFGLTSAILESIGSGEVDFADHLVIPHNRKAVEAMHGQIARMKVTDPNVSTPDTWLLDRSWFQEESSQRFNNARIDEFRNQLEQWRGSTISDEELRTACASYTENRKLLGEVMALRFAAPARLSGSDALAIIRAGQIIPVEQHNDLLRALLANTDDLPELSGPRIFLAGSPFDHGQLYEIVEAAGGIVVGEDHCFGMRCIEHVLDQNDDPMLAIAARYHRTSGCSISYPLQRNVDACLRRAQACKAGAVLFAVMNEDQTHIWTTPDELAAIRAAGLQALHVGQLAYTVGEQTVAEIQAFVEGLR